MNDYLNRFSIFPLAIFLCFSCDSNPKGKQREEKNLNSEIQQNDEINENSTDELDTLSKTFNGAWFSIEYPSSFDVIPAAPIQETENYTFVETDEATFISPDKEIEFFVFSPQWIGEPKNALKIGNNEIVISSKEDVDKNNPEIVKKWITLKDKKNEYFRSIYSSKTESTHLVFCVKYKTQETYEKYKKQYLKFKKSLKQFAD